MEKSKLIKPLGWIAPLLYAGCAAFYFGLESAEIPNMLGENTPPLVVYIIVGTLMFTVIGFLLGKYTALKGNGAPNRRGKEV